MKKLLFLLTFSFVLQLQTSEVQAQACTHYASATGSGATCTVGTPCLINSFWAIAAAGNVLCLNDGTYTGANSMIQPTQGLSGASNNPITVRALNDGQVLIDGEYARTPVRLYFNDYFTLDGFNAAHSGTDWDWAVININRSNNVVMRRVIAWDSYDSGVQTPGDPNSSNNSVWITNSSQNGLYEDVAAFGTGRYNFLLITYSAAAINNIYRRAFCHFTKQISLGSYPRGCSVPQYAVVDNLIENLIGQWQPLEVTEGGEMWGIGQGTGTGVASDATVGGLRVYGSLMTTMADASRQTTTDSGLLAENAGPHDVHFKDVVAYVPPGVTANAGIFRNPSLYSQPVDSIDLTNLTLINGNANILGNEWVQTNVVEYASIAAMDAASANPLQTSAGTGARLCYRYVDGTLTTNPLWPWPMETRINAAVNAAGYSSDTFFGTGKNLTTYVESIFGTIPAGCRANPVVAASGNGTTSTTTIDITWTNNIFTPLSNIDNTKFACTENGTPLTETGTVLVGTNITRTTVSETMSGGTTIACTVSASAVQGTYCATCTDGPASANQGSVSITNNIGGGGSYVWTQKYFRFHGLRGTEASPVVYPYQSAAVNTNIKAVPGARFRVRLKVACTTADCPAIGMALRYSLNGGAYTAVPDTFGADNIRFYGNGDSSTDIPTQGTATTELLTSDHVTNVACAIERTSAAVPNVDLSQNSETECEYIVELDTDVAADATYDFRLYNQDGTALNTYTVTPRATVIAMQAGGGF